ncbi:MAG: tol-pal system-associated acyl-CoA thioesterase [Litorivicinus sp.]
MHSWPVRVYYEDTDAGGVVFYANYLKFFERGRTEWLRELGYQSQSMLEQQDLVLVVRHVDVQYLAPARLDDELSIVTRVSTLGGSSLVFEQQAVRDQQCLVSASVTVVCVNTQTFKATRIPVSMRESIEHSNKDKA